MASNNHGEKAALHYVICWLLGNKKVRKIEVENPDDFLIQSKNLLIGEFKSSKTKVSKQQYLDGLAQLYKRYLEGERKLWLVTTLKAKPRNSDKWPNQDLFVEVKKSSKWNSKWKSTFEDFLKFYNCINFFSFPEDVNVTRKILLESSAKKLENISSQGSKGDRADLIINKFLNYFSGEKRNFPITRELIVDAYEKNDSVKNKFKIAIENDDSIAMHHRTEIFLEMDSLLENNIYYAIDKLKTGKIPKTYIEKAAWHLKGCIYED